MPNRRTYTLAGLVALCAAGVAYAQGIPVVDDCSEPMYLDRTSANADRSLDWSYSFEGGPERCIIVRVGQSVQWQGNFGDHPLDADQGDTPNPIQAHVNGLVLFDRAGIFGFRCNYHLGMRGAVRVVAATEAEAVPASNALGTLGVVASLLAAGMFFARGVQKRAR